ncbi:MAG: hypothetical protein L3J16_00550 [Anaerolineales bacterium]|nr:hypothetical protein [Anaerolineales bacterium]
MKIRTNRILVVGLALLTMALLSACSGPDEHIWLKSPGWSRAVFLGNTNLNDPVPITLNDAGQVYLVLFSANEDRTETFFNVIALDADGLPLWQRQLDEISLHSPNAPQIVWDAGRLRLFWLDEESLYTVSLYANGSLRSDPIRLSEDLTVDSYSVAAVSSGAYSLWFAGPRSDPGVYALSSLDGNGKLTSIDPDGIRITLAYDQTDTLHATWLQYPIGYGASRLLYGKYLPEAGLTTVEPRILHEWSVGPANGLDGPVMGIDSNNVYVFWTVIIRTGFEAGAVETSYIHFPLTPFFSASQPQPIAVPSIYGLQYEYLSNSPFDAGERVSLRGSNIPRTIDLQEIMPNPVQADELAIIFRSPMQHLWRKVRDQVNIAYFYEGEPSSFQPLSFTTTLSTSPNLLNSADRHLYAVWLEKMEINRYAVYFASTSPAIENSLSRSTSRELGRVAAQAIFGILVGVLMAPVAAGVWVVAPLAILLLFAPLRKIGSLRVQNVFSAISILLAITVFWFGKLATLPGIMDYVPFSAWVPQIPPTLAEVLRLGVPIVSSLLAVFVAWFYTYRQSNKSTLYFLLIYVGVDSLLTAAVYAVLIYGAI